MIALIRRWMTAAVKAIRAHGFGLDDLILIAGTVIAWRAAAAFHADAANLALGLWLIYIALPKHPRPPQQPPSK